MPLGGAAPAVGGLMPCVVAVAVAAPCAPVAGVVVVAPAAVAPRVVAVVVEPEPAFAVALPARLHVDGLAAVAAAEPALVAGAPVRQHVGGLVVVVVVVVAAAHGLVLDGLGCRLAALPAVAAVLVAAGIVDRVGGPAGGLAAWLPVKEGWSAAAGVAVVPSRAAWGQVSAAYRRPGPSSRGGFHRSLQVCCWGAVVGDLGRGLVADGCSAPCRVRLGAANRERRGAGLARRPARQHPRRPRRLLLRMRLHGCRRGRHWAWATTWGRELAAECCCYCY